MTNGKVASIVVECRSQEELNDIIATNAKAVVLYYSYAMP
jgi:hypothetical protein